MSDHDDFWGDVPDWTVGDGEQPARRSRSTRPVRPSARDRFTGWSARFGSLLTRDADATREHRVVETHGDSPIDSPVDGAANPEYDAPRAASARTGDFDVAFTDVDAIADDLERASHTTGWDTHEDSRPELASRRRDDRPTGGVDPLLARFGAAAIVLTLMVPLAINLTSDGGSDDLVAGAAADSTSVQPTLGSIDPAEAATTAGDTSEVTTATYLDPADLPPAVPVNDVDGPDEGVDDDTETSARGTDQSEAGSDTTATAAASDAGIADPADADDQADRLRIECAIDYTVDQGDYWIGLADRSGVDLADLLAVNGATVDTPLYPGSEICLPAGASTPAPTSAPATTTATTVTTATTPPTTAAPATTATPTTQAPTTTSTTTTVPFVAVGPDEIIEIIRDVWPDDLEDRALEVAYRESRYVPTAKNYCCYGLFQIYWSVHQSWLADMGVTSAEQLFDPETNARAAYALYQRAGGWGPWSL